MLITAVVMGTRGDVSPITALARTMCSRGHNFRILTHEAFRPLVEASGAQFCLLDSDADHLMQYLVTDYVTSLDFMRGMWKLRRENPGYMDQTLEAIRGSDLVMYGTCSAFARHAAEALHIPCVRYFYSPMDPTRQYSLYDTGYNTDKVLRSYSGLSTGMNLMTMLALQAYRKKAGLPRWTLRSSYTEMNGQKLLTFYPTSRVLMPPDPTWGPHIHVTGYWYHPDDDAQGYTPPADLEAFLAGGDKPIFIVFGKAQSPELAELQSRVLQAVRRTKLRAIMQGNQLPAALRQSDAQVYFAPDMPYAYIFPKVRAVVHHGGNTTNGLGLRAGLPTLVIPLALDQYFYGRMDHHIHAGPKPLYIRKKLCTVSEIESALCKLVSGRYDEGAARAAAQIRREDGLTEAAEAIERYIALW